jgi:subtilase family serine protease
MRRNITLIAVALSAIILLSLARGRAQAQNAVPSRITSAIDESKLTVLHGNTRTLPRTAFDRGPAADNLQMDQMLLVLQRSASQQAALDRLLAAQQDKTSAEYHQWLSPEQFGEQFGASDSDIQKITAWLESHGFQVNSVSKGRNLINFSGSAGEVRQAFHTTMHQYVVGTRDHLANAADPAIPSALASVVAGVRSLNDFFPKAAHHARSGQGFTASIKPHLTLKDGSGNTLYGVGPYDFATIYGITPLWNASPAIDGTGVTIAIVSASDINITDVNQFRALFSLPSINFLKVIPSGSTDPGVVGASSNGGPDGDEDETEAVFDVEWSGSVAKNAKIDLVASKDTATSAGIDLSAQYIVNTKLAPILSESYGSCELGLGSAGNTFYNNMWSQAAAEGITVSIATGDEGSDGCDPGLGADPNPDAPSQQEGVYGLGVNGIASTPYDVGVGGTDFNDHVTPNSFWSSTSAPGTELSAESYVPETTWNDSCTSSLVYTTFGDSSAAQACNDPSVQDLGNNGNINSGGFFFVAPTGGGGGKSNCTTSNGSATVDCTGGWAKPSWQSGPGVPADGKRDLPDVSFFADGGQDSYGLEQAKGTNVPGSFYFTCEEDALSSPEACSVNGEFLLGGGTSISAQVFAGVMALINQRTGSAQGNVNATFYPLAAGQSALNCNSSSTTTPPNSACIFHDVTSGTIAQPCLTPSTSDGTSDCSTAGGGSIGILTGYNAGTGYDQATGLGSINVANLASAMPYLSVAASPTTVSVASPGSSGSTTITFTGNNGYAATINGLTCSGLPKGASCAFSQNGSAVSSVTLSSGSPTAAVTLTVNTTAASTVPPAEYFGGMKTVPGALILLATALAFTAFVFGGRKNTRWTPAYAVLGFVLLIAMAGCGGAVSGNGGSGNGGGNGGSGATPTGTTTVTVSGTNTGNSSSVSLNVTLTVS